MMVELTHLPPVSEPLPWHREAWELCGEQLAAGRMPHALLLAGAEGTGKAQFALALARLLLCDTAKDGHNCGECHACDLSAAGGHGDLCWLQPEEKSRVIKIDQVRHAVTFANQTASFGTRKVVAIYPADTMNVNAANALLKALEEPVPDTFLILVCQRMHGVPATIRSRCQIMRLPGPDREQARLWLGQVAGGPGAGIDTVLELVDGRPLAAELLLREERVEEVAATRAALGAILNGRVTALEAIGPLAELEAGDFLLELQVALRQQVRLCNSRELCSESTKAAFALDEEISRLRAALAAGSNPNASLLVESLLARCERELGSQLRGDNM